MIYKFIDQFGTFIIRNPSNYNAYFPLTNKDGSILSAINPNLAGDIKSDNEHFLNIPSSIIDIKNNLLCRREFFIKINNKTRRLSQAYKNDTLECGLLYHKLTKKINNLEIKIINFVPYNLKAEVMHLTLENKSKKDITITPTSFIPLYGRSEKNLRDHRHVSSLLNRIKLNKYGILLKPTMIFDEKGHKENFTTYYAFGFEDKALALKGQFPTLEEFLGKNDIINPEILTNNIGSIQKEKPQHQGKEVCAGFNFASKTLKPGQKTSYTIILGINDDLENINQIFKALNSPEKIRQSLETTKNYWINYLKKIQFNFFDKNYDNWLIWVKLQPTLRKLFGCSFLPHFDYGKGGRGWRDLWQDALTLLLTESQKAKDLIINNFCGVRLDGSNATIITKNGFISDRNSIVRVWMDHGVWPYLTLKLYLNRTGDLSLLLKDVNYFSDHQLKHAIGAGAIRELPLQNDYLLRDKTNKLYQGSILEHILVQNLVQFFNVGEHNIIKLENADWNDGLDMAAKKGESVTFSFMYAHNINDLCIFLEELKKHTKVISLLKEFNLLLDSIFKPINYSNYKEKQNRLDLYFTAINNISGEKMTIPIDNLIIDLKNKAKHLFTWLNTKEWLPIGFFNGYYDNSGLRVEGKKNNSLRMLLQSQVFAIISGVASPKQIEETFTSIKKYLYDKNLKGFHLNTNFNSLYLDFGRAFGFSYGDKENGAFFNHMIIMLSNALYKQGFIEEGFFVLNSIYNMASDNKAEIYPCIPEYFNNQGKGLYLYLTGSASWYIYTLFEQVLGIKFHLGDLILEPKLTKDNVFNNKIEIYIDIEDKPFKIVFIIDKKLPNKVYKIKNVLLNEQTTFLGTKVVHNDNYCQIKKEWLKNISEVKIVLN